MSPAGPDKCGSTIYKVKPVATAASKALPPRSRIDIPTAEASQWVELTAPKVPMISGRVVNFAPAGATARTGAIKNRFPALSSKSLRPSKQRRRTPAGR